MARQENRFIIAIAMQPPRESRVGTPFAWAVSVEVRTRDDVNGSVSETQLGRLFVVATLYLVNADGSVTPARADCLSTSSTVRSVHTPEPHESASPSAANPVVGFSSFDEVSVSLAGTYRLRFTLFQMAPGDQGSNVPFQGATTLDSVDSASFTITA